jgi:hypothetical protein
MEARALGSLALQPSQPLRCILNLSNTRVGVFPEGEEFLVMIYGFAAFLLNLLIILAPGGSSFVADPESEDRSPEGR